MSHAALTLSSSNGVGVCARNLFKAAKFALRKLFFFFSCDGKSEEPLEENCIVIADYRQGMCTSAIRDDWSNPPNA